MKSDIIDIKIIRAASSAIISLLTIVPKRIPKSVGVENSSTEVATMRGALPQNQAQATGSNQ